AAGHAHFLLNDVDDDFGTGVSRDALGDLGAPALVHHRANEPEGRRVAEEDLGERTSDDALEPGTLDGLRRVLAARAATEVVASNDDGGASVLRVVEGVI